MAIVTLTGGSRVVKIKVDFRASSLIEVRDEVSSNPNVYSEKVFVLDSGGYVFVDADDNVGAVGADILDPGKSATDGPADLSSGSVSLDLSALGNQNNLDLSTISPNPGTGADGVSILNLTNNSGGVIQIRGIVAPSTSKTMVIYNLGADVVRLRPENANATAENRFAINANINIGANEGLWVFYDGSSQRWRALNI